MSREINVLLLGETGSGKSTTINAIANYLKFTTFEEARDNLAHLQELIPSNFTLPVGCGGQFIVKSGDDANERSGGGQSATVAPACYLFPFDDFILRIIDTPGIGDTAGVKADVSNVDLIMGFLTPYDRLHGVVIVVNGKSNRKTTFFTYCIKNLIEQLHCSIKQNIVFCFTNSEISAGKFGPDSGYEVLEALLKEDIPEVGLHLKKASDDRNCFYVEHQCYRLLVAVKRGYKISELEEKGSTLSWNNSTKEIRAMIRRIRALPPHELKETISINNAKQFIRSMFQPIVVLMKNLDEKIEQVKKCQEEINRLTDECKDLKENADRLMEWYQKMNRFDVEMVARKKPVLVCTAPKCIDLVMYEGENKCHFKTHCCDPCYNILLWNGTVGETGIGWCKVMNGLWSPVCSKCGCEGSFHRRDAYDYVKVERPMANEEYDELKGKLSAACSQKEQKELLLDDLNQTIEEMQAEKCQVEKICVQLDYFISEQSLMKRKSKFAECLDELSVAMINDPHKKYEYTSNDLQSIKEGHMRRFRDLVMYISIPCIGVADIQPLQKQLLALKHSGAFFRNIIEENRKLIELAKKNETIVAVGRQFVSKWANQLIGQPDNKMLQDVRMTQLHPPIASTIERPVPTPVVQEYVDCTIL